MRKRGIAFSLVGILLLCAALSAGLTGGLAQAEPVQLSDTENLEEDNMTALEFAKGLKIGWNLGNTFEAPTGETGWGNPMTSQALILYVKELGFETIRIPISWSGHVSDAPEYKIDESFMNRIDTVINQALDAGLYVIINSHHDNDIYTPIPDNCEQGKEYLTAIWSQIAAHFADTDSRLIFETMNEPRVVGASYEWNIDTQDEDCMTAVATVNELNQAALDAIRASGGENENRYVLVSVYTGSPNSTAGSTFRLPEDSAEDKLIVALHAYVPYNFALNKNSDDSTFDKKDEAEIITLMKTINYRFVSKGIPVIFDEMGCIDKSNPDDRYAWCKAFVSAAAEYGIPCVWWDNGYTGTDGESFGMINRRKLKIYDQSASALQGLMDGLTSTEDEG